MLKRIAPLLAFAAAPLPAAVPAHPGFLVQRLAHDVNAVVRTDPPGLMVDGNSLFIVNDRDVVVDAPEASAELFDALKGITDNPVSHLINTRPARSRSDTGAARP